MLTKTQRSALEKLIDGRFHSLLGFTTNTRVSLYERGLIEDRGPHGIITRVDLRPARLEESVGSAHLDYRITDEGRAMILELRALALTDASR